MLGCGSAAAAEGIQGDDPIASTIAMTITR
jgi:hypothetical protein